MEEEPEALAEETEDEGDGDGEEEAEAEEVEAEPVVAAAEKKITPRRPPAASRERQLREQPGAVVKAAGGLQEIRGGIPLDRATYAKVVRDVVQRWGVPSRHAGGVEEKRRVAHADFQFPQERVLTSDASLNTEKIRSVMPDYIPGVYGRLSGDALVASGGLCAPLEPIYSMPNFAVTERPVRDALPSFQADRGGVNVPAATTIGDITTAISNISEEYDALGGTFATKSCQDLDCPDYTEVAVQIIAHCRMYGNLNARAWPEKIEHENDLTMAAHARTAESFLLSRIKTLSINVTQAEVLGARLLIQAGK